MSANADWDVEDEFAENESETETPGTAMKKLRAELAKLRREHNKANAELQAARAELSKTALTSIFEEYDVPAKARAIYLKLGNEATREAVEEWVKEHGELWGVTREAESDETRQVREAFEKTDQVTSRGNPPPQKREVTDADLGEMSYSDLMRAMHG